MEIVRENILFKRGMDSKHSLKIGSAEIIHEWFNEFASDADYEVDEDLHVKVNGDLYLYHSKITSLPDNLTVNGYLHLEWSIITSLPDNLSVGGYLYLRDTGITSLPDNLKVAEKIYKNF